MSRVIVDYIKKKNRLNEALTYIQKQDATINAPKRKPCEQKKTKEYFFLLLTFQILGQLYIMTCPT